MSGSKSSPQKLPKEIKNRVTVVVPYYRTPNSLLSLVRNLAGQVPIVVVNNASQLPLGLKNLAGVKVITNPHNYGFARAANQGARLVTTEFVLFINPDCHILPEQIAELYQAAVRLRLDAASPTLVNAGGVQQPQYHQPLPNFFNLFRQLTPVQRILPPIGTASILPGACLLLSTNAWRKIGGWDERFWLWWEDADVTVRLLKHGFRLAVLPEIKVNHQGGESFESLDSVWRRQVFFHSLRIFIHAHFTGLAKIILILFTKRFAANQLYPTDPQLRCSVVVPNYDGKLLQSFLAQNYRSFDFDRDELIIVSSAPIVSDAMAGGLIQKYPKAIFIYLTVNKGFAPTVNMGLRRARGQYCLTVNDDTVLAGPGWIDELIKLVTAKTGSVSPQILKPSGQVESLGVKVLPWGKALPITQGSSVTFKPDGGSNSDLGPDLGEPEAFNAAAVLLTRPALSAVGLFDERFGSYLEDIDLGLRMKRSGFIHQVAPQSLVTHLGQQTSHRRPVYKAWLDCKNWWLVILKHTSLSGWVWYGGKIALERGRNLSGLIKAFLAG